MFVEIHFVVRLSICVTDTTESVMTKYERVCLHDIWGVIFE